MLQRNQAGLKLINILSDLLIILLSCFFAWRIRFDVLDGINNVNISDLTLVLLTILFSLVNTVLLWEFNIYSPQRLRKAGANTLRIFLANGICALLLMTLLFLFKIMDMPRLLIGISWLVSSALVSVKHMLLHLLLHRMRKKGYNLRHYVLVGNGHLAHQYVENVRNNPFTGICVDGYFSAVEKPELGKCLGRYEDMESVLANTRYDGLVIALESHEVRFMVDVLRVADKEGIPVELIPFFNDYYPSFPTFEKIGSSRLIDLRATPLNRAENAVLKRGFDVVFSFLVLALLSPLMLAVAIGVKISSPGPVIFRQERIGRDRKPFIMYKFRSMRMTGTENTAWSRAEDPRRTKFGSFIRKFSLDELPQFWNVLKGDMSVIGPRPEIPFHVNHFKKEIPRYLVRQQVRPGITGWAQVNGLRGDTSIEDRVRYDIEYIENWTIGFDIRIIFRTLFGAMMNNER